MRQELSVSNRVQQYVMLLREIGMPGKIPKKANEKERPVPTAELLRLAELNKISFLYLSNLEDMPPIEAQNRTPDTLDRLSIRNKVLIQTIQEVASIFDKEKIRYCVFKTIKPFPTTPSDVDILIAKKDFGFAQSILSSSGYNLAAKDEYSATMHGKSMIVDLQTQPSVSNLPYLPAEMILQNSVARNIQGVDVFSPSDEAELLTIACHSLYKEQLFTLNDYYSIVLLSERIDIGKLVDLAKSTRTLDALQIIIEVSVRITEAAFDSKLRVHEIGKHFGHPSYSPQVLDMPLHFPFSLVLKMLFSRCLRDPQMRKRFLPALIRIASPRQFAKLLSHLIRKTY